ncbi:hypothetical protein EON66_12415 [archaeon]|nr:MAG: hypothetical protein EON66_12415 [archaeon]
MQADMHMRGGAMPPSDEGSMGVRLSDGSLLHDAQHAGSEVGSSHGGMVPFEHVPPMLPAASAQQQHAQHDNIESGKGMSGAEHMQ